MYNQYYHFKENPFNITSDPDFYFSSSRHSEAFSHLIYGIKQRTGIIVMTGEIGTGKTTLCRTLLNRLDPETKTALVLNPSFSEIQLLQLIIKDFGIEGKFKNKFELIEALNRFLLEETAAGHNVVLIIDEAQNLKVRQMEQIRLLSNLETEKEKLLQIILVGQPELQELLRNPALRQVNQRIGVRFHILPLKHEELKDYIYHRLKVATDPALSTAPIEFTDKAIEVIYNLSQGTPRMVNLICDRALLAGFTRETYLIDEEIVSACAEEVGAA
jgi:general secretion pathway protein A